MVSKKTLEINPRHPIIASLKTKAVADEAAIDADTRDIVGILYDSAALAAAWDLCKDWKIEDHERLRADVARVGLKARIGGRTVQDVAQDLLAIAHQGLKARNRLSAGMVDETGYLAELEEIAASGMTPAERILELYNGPWAGDASKVFEAFAY